MVFTAELARRYGDQGIMATAVNPGNIETELNRNQNRVTVWLAVSDNNLKQAGSSLRTYSIDFAIPCHLVYWAIYMQLQAQKQRI
jgi:NAD(P)-dependent dehydrogenase (short-subunit alcohol dehydrogenase family)